ncbi:MAG TPA: type III-B CRISPR-associated protein Cas10/Cmr2 [Chitinophagales bacterium]|jgi:CRISPR-associated protein Cmr2|nr:type III-B CRISPR-associated protein Cas10/Cmr2 [Chitinophagales bacterium]
MNKNYFAITIGPIVKTMGQAKYTKEIWLSSYFFSYVMKILVEKAKVKGNIILPFTAENTTTFDETEPLFGAGIYPDRLIMEVNDEHIKELDKEIIEKALKEISSNTQIDFNKLKSYLNIHSITISEDELNKLELVEEDGKPITSFIHKLNRLLDVQELNPNYITDESAFINDLFDSKTVAAFNTLAFENKKHKFKTIIDIIAQGNNKIKNLLENSEKDESNILNDTSITEELSKHEKYLVILRADGDNFGKVITAISDNETQIKKFSSDLIAFSKAAAQIINTYGGVNIYIGGDDILAFCPVKTSASNIFQLVNELNKKFQEIFKDDIYKTNSVSLSYGLTITYYKYPLQEALERSAECLFGIAKKEALKNCITFELMQHSGSIRATTLNFSKDSNFDTFLKMLNDVKEKDQLLQSLTHQLTEDEVLLKACLKNKSIDAYFDNHYNPENKNASVKDFIQAMRDNLKANYQILIDTNIKLKSEGKKEIENIEELALKQMNTIAKTINFLK